METPNNSGRQNVKTKIVGSFFTYFYFIDGFIAFHLGNFMLNSMPLKAFKIIIFIKNIYTYIYIETNGSTVKTHQFSSRINRLNGLTADIFDLQTFTHRMSETREVVRL